MNIDILDWPGSQDDTQKLPTHSNPARSQTASNSSDSADETLEKLVQITYDGEQGFLHAAQNVHDRGLREEFQKFARERRSITTELTRFLGDLGKSCTPHQSSTRASLHRTWMNVRTYLTEHDDQSILDEVERGEDEATRVFQLALSQPLALTPAAHSLTATAYQKIQRAHDRIRSLRDSGIYQHNP